MDLVKVVIPIYKVDLPSLYIKILQHNLNMLHKYIIVFICPVDLDISKLLLNFSTNKIEIERFDGIYFQGIEGYNSLMLSSSFYSRFSNTKYILICQTDAFVFRDELLFWCDKNYDYIGAPWIGSSNSFYNISLRKINNVIRRLKGKRARNWEHLFKVGNGGFSLRKVQLHFSIAKNYSEVIEEYLKDKNSIYHVEDVFWSMKAPLLDSSFSIPDYKEAVSFAIDRKPEIAMELNGGNVPFACHGYDKPKVENFWKPLLAKYSI
ncbi:DUF5672 family protein [Dysgonomonas sp. HGC4]|uniref:DUF5672 family protein n=1 Tax=Dysgonomonas sp. HGC4 TaxID=1658009 RepID=UPI000682AA45|nr:DUF5672 family protein [Dysgonomonas sp. HGC4]MBD8347001.1 hypothetical protein [Dysgonomonas sp. HGC4]